LSSFSEFRARSALNSCMNPMTTFTATASRVTNPVR